MWGIMLFLFTTGACPPYNAHVKHWKGVSPILCSSTLHKECIVSFPLYYTCRVWVGLSHNCHCDKIRPCRTAHTTLQI